MKNWRSGEEVTYAYDSVNRLISAVTTGPEWGQSFSYDGFGNMTAQTVTKGTAPSITLHYSASTNRITDSGYTYDSNGNLTKLPLLTSLVYDVENRLVQAVHSSNGTDNYAYDPSNRRVWKKKPNGQEEVYFYGVDGVKLGTYRGTFNSSGFSTAHTNVWFAGRLIRAEGSAVVTDRLGSVVGGSWRCFP